ncbi:hypothetical protein Tco_1027408 [Tanacetum coccineum]
MNGARARQDILGDKTLDVHEVMRNMWSMSQEKKKGRRVKLVEFQTKVHTKKGTKPKEPGLTGILKFVDPMSKQ